MIHKCFGLGWVAGPWILGTLILSFPGEAMSAQVIQIGPLRKVTTLAMAATLAKDGDTLEVDAGTYPADVAIWTQNHLTIRAVGGRVRLVALGAAVENKGIWVVRGGRIEVQGLDFVGAKSSYRNGSGIRFEKGQLTIKDCSFFNNENGILTGSDQDAELTIENSEFGYNGFGDGQSHNLYVGRIKKLVVTGSYIHHANVGHLLKSRAAENHIVFNRLADEHDGRASYELEFPNGGIAYVLNNIIAQGSRTENPIVISFGAENYTWPRNELYLVGNTLVDDLPKGGKWIAVKPIDQGSQDATTVTVLVKAMNNLLVGDGSLDAGASSDIRNNLNVDRSVFVQACRQDYRLRNPRHPPLKPVAPGMANGVNLGPQWEYSPPGRYWGGSCQIG